MGSYVVSWTEYTIRYLSYPNNLVNYKYLRENFLIFCSTSVVDHNKDN